MKRYSTVRKDFEFLETISELDDQVELDAARQDLMRDPTKRRAAMMYDSAIRLWFHEHGITFQTQEIANRYNIK